MSNVECQKTSMNSGFRFEKLEIWQLARQLNKTVYQLTSRFPACESYGLTNQLRRACVSVSSNIAEGSGRNSDKDFAHFLEQAYGSLMEVASQLYLAMDLTYIQAADVANLQKEMAILASKIVALNRSFNVADSKVKLPALDPRPSTFDQ